MKPFKILLLISTVTILHTACNKQLDIEPQQSVDASDAIKTPENVDAAAIGMYSLLGNGALYGTNLLMLPELQAQMNTCHGAEAFRASGRWPTNPCPATSAEACEQ